MAVTDNDVWRLAKILVENLGEEAVALAATEADHLLKEGDVGGRTDWLLVKQACEDLLAGSGSGRIIN